MNSKSLLRAVVVLFIVSAAFTTVGQDIHYSQFFRSPMTLNPALTGKIDEDYRIHAIHRDQWSALNSTFASTAFGFDMNFKEGILKHDKVGAGLTFYRDQLGEGVFKNTSIQLSGSYHRTLDVHKRHHLSGGIQLGYVQKSVDFSSLQFFNQYNGFIYDQSLGNGEDLNTANVNYIDIQAGLYYYYRLNNETKFHAGISGYEITTPQETFANRVDTIVADPNEIGSRIVVHAGLDYQLNTQMVLSPKMLFMQQSKGRDIMLGSLLAYKLSGFDASLIVGGYYRFGDAGIIMAGMKYRNVDVLLSYDRTISGLRQAAGAEGTRGNGSVGAWEISIQFKGLLSRAVPNDYTVPCGIF